MPPKAGWFGQVSGAFHVKWLLAGVLPAEAVPDTLHKYAVHDKIQRLVFAARLGKNAGSKTPGAGCVGAHLVQGVRVLLGGVKGGVHVWLAILIGVHARCSSAMLHLQR